VTFVQPAIDESVNRPMLISTWGHGDELPINWTKCWSRPTVHV